MARSALRTRRRRRAIVLTTALLFFLIWGLLYLATTSFFLRLAVLPLVGEIIGAELHAAEISFSVCRARLAVNDLVLGSRKDPLITVKRGVLETSWRNILRGKLDFSDCVFSGVEVVFHHDAVAGWNLLGAAEKRKWAGRGDTIPAREHAVSGGGATEEVAVPEILFRKIRVENASVELRLDGASGARRLMLRDAEVDADGIGPAGNPRLKATGRLFFDSPAAAELEQGRFELNLSAGFSPQWLPRTFAGRVSVTDCAGTAGRVRFAHRDLHMTLSGGFDGRILSWKNARFSDFSDGVLSGLVKSSGAIDFEENAFFLEFPEISVSPALSSLLLGSACDFDPGELRIHGSGRLACDENRFSLRGALAGSRRGAARFAGRGVMLPNLGASGNFDFALDDAARTVDVKKAELKIIDLEAADASSEGSCILALKKPAAYTWSENAASSETADFSLEFRNYPMGALKLASRTPSEFPLRDGRMNGEFGIRVGHGLKDIRWKGFLSAEPMHFVFGAKSFLDMGAELSLELSSSKRGAVKLEKLSGTLRHGVRELGRLNGSGEYSCFRHSGSGDFTLEMLPFAAAAATRSEAFRETAEVLPNARGRLEFHCFADLKNNRFEGTDVTFRLENGKKELFRAATPLFAWNVGKMSLETPCRIAFQGQRLPPALLRAPARRLGMELAGGALDLSGRGELLSFAPDFAFSGRLGGGGLMLRRGDCTVDELAGAVDFNVRRTARDGVVLEKTSGVLSCGANELLRFTLSGAIPADRNAAPHAELNFANGRFELLNFLCGGALFRGGACSGRIALDGAGKALRFASELQAGNLASARPGVTASGVLSVRMAVSPEDVVLEKASLHLSGDGRTVADVSAHGVLGIAGRSRRMELRSPLLDLEFIDRFFRGGAAAGRSTGGGGYAFSWWNFLLRLLGVTEQKSERTETEAEAAAGFYFNGLTRIDCFLEHLTYGSENQASLNGALELAHSRITANGVKIVLNGCRAAADLQLRSREEGLSCLFRGRTYGVLELRPILQIFVPESLQAMRCAMKGLEWRCESAFPRWADFSRDLNGGLDAEFGHVVVPNSFGTGTWGRVMMLPLDVLPELAGLIPNLKESRFYGFFNVADKLRAKTREIPFSSGAIRLRARRGVLHVAEFQFDGDMVERVTFSGEALLKEPRTLKLKSTVDINGAIVPIEIKGTLDAPSVNLKKTVKSLIHDNTNAFFRSVTGWFSAAPEGEEED